MNEPRTPYWWAFLKHPNNKLALLGLLTTAVLLSLPWGGDGFGVGMLALAAIQMVGLATVPGLPTFQARDDAMDRQRTRQSRRDALLLEVKAQGGSTYLRGYEQMSARVASLYRTAGNASTALSTREVERLDDLTVDYLRMCVSDAVARGSNKADLTAGVERKLRDLKSKLAAGGLDRDNEQQLLRAQADYEEALVRHNRMASRRSALEAALVSMPVRMEEVHQMVMTSPQAGNLSQLLEESVDKLRLAEEAALDVEHMLGPARLEPMSIKTSDTAAAAAAAAAGRRTVGQRD